MSDLSKLALKMIIFYLIIIALFLIPMYVLR